MSVVLYVRSRLRDLGNEILLTNDCAILISSFDEATS